MTHTYEVPVTYWVMVEAENASDAYEQVNQMPDFEIVIRDEGGSIGEPQQMEDDD